MNLNREKLAEMLGCSLRTVDEYRRNGMPGESPKRPGDQWKFESAVVVGWLRDRERTDALGEMARVDEAEAKRRKLAAEASLAEHELATKQGNSVGIADFEAAWAAMIGAAKAKLLGLGKSLGPEVAPLDDALDCSIAIDSAVKESLAELSEFNPGVQIFPSFTEESGAEDSGDIEVVGSSAEPHGERMGGH
jgi:hypothetical protein